MSNKKIVGLFIIAQGFFVLVLTIMLGQIAFHLDKIDGTFVDDIMNFYPSIVYFAIIAIFIIGIYLMFSSKEQ
ncbi:hypothetical protein [Intestinibacter sp.]